MENSGYLAEGVLNSKVALVTGAGHGIGKVTAFLLARLGARVIVNDIDGDTARQTAQEIVQAGWQGSAAPADITQRNRVTELVNKIVADQSSLDILVNNAGSTLGEPRHDHFTSESEELIDRIIQLNLMGAVWCSRAVISHMQGRGQGCIISVSSSVALPGDGKFIAYATAKGGIISFTRSLARAVAPYGVRVNCVVPGTINSARRSPEYLAKQVQRVPMGRAGTPEEVADTIAFLAAPAASFITGQALAVNGGQTMY